MGMTCLLPRRKLFPPLGAAVVVGGLVLVALLVRLWGVGAAPLHPDELHYAYDFMAGEETAGLHAIRGLDCAMLAERRTAHPMLAALLTRWLWFLPLGWLVDWTPGFLRGFNVIAGALVVLPAWLAGRLAWGRGGAALAAVLVATGAGLVLISRTAYLDPVYTLFAAGWLAAVAWGWRGGGGRAAVAQGMLFGLVLSTKISAPLLAPAFAAGLLLAPQGTRWRARLERLVAGGLAACALWVLLCDPGAYWLAISQPTDVRYAAAWEGEDAAGLLNLLFVHLDYFVSAALWQGPLPVVALAAAGIGVAWRARDPFMAFLVLVLLSLTPLFLLHHPRLSGSHGFMPIYMVLALMAGRAVVLPRCLLGALLVLHGVFTLLTLSPGVLREVPLGEANGNFVAEDARYDLLRPWLHRRGEPVSIVILGTPSGRAAWVGAVRNAQLSEGAVVLVPCGDDARPDGGAWQWGDLVVIHDDHGALLEEVPEEFEWKGRLEEDGYTLFRRIAGSARREMTVGELALRSGKPSGPWRLCLPGDIQVLSGRWHGGDGLVADPFGNSPYFRGPFVHGPPPGGGAGEGEVLRIRPPRRGDVLWGF